MTPTSRRQHVLTSDVSPPCDNGDGRDNTIVVDEPSACGMSAISENTTFPFGSSPAARGIADDAGLEPAYEDIKDGWFEFALSGEPMTALATLTRDSHVGIRLARPVV